MLRKHNEHLLPHDSTLHTHGRQVSQGQGLRWGEKTVRQSPRKIPCSPSAHLSIVDIVDFIKDDPLQVSDDV